MYLMLFQIDISRQEPVIKHLHMPGKLKSS